MPRQLFAPAYNSGVGPFTVPPIRAILAGEGFNR